MPQPDHKMESKLFDAICYNFTEEQLTEIAFARSITATLCCVISVVVLVILFIRAKIDYHKVCGTVVKRLAIGLTVVSVLQQFNLALGLINHFTPDLEGFCQVNGFLNQYFDSVQWLFTLGITLVLFLKVARGTCSWKCFTVCCKNTTGHTFTWCRREINKVEVAVYISTFGFPLLLDWIPFVTHSYGPYGTWCWIQNNCSNHTAGFWEQILLGKIPFGLVALITLVLFITSLCLLRHAIKNVKLDSLLSIAFLVFMCMLLFAQELVIPSHNGYIAWVLIAISTPLCGTFTPLALLAVIHLPLSSMIVCSCCKHQRHSECDHEEEQVTLHRSSNWSLLHQPSYTTWCSPHSSNDSVDLSFVKLQDYGSINAR